jgi:large subunit ribosomal protein L30
MAKTAKKTDTKKPVRGSKRGSGAKSAQRVTVTLVKSTIGFGRKQAAVVEGLGLRRINHTVDLADTPSVRGMIHKVRHLVEVK